MNLNSSIDKRWWQSLQSSSSMLHQRTTILIVYRPTVHRSLRLESIDISYRSILSRQQPRFLQATFQLHQSRYFQQQSLESISGCTFSFASGLSSSKKSRRVNESESDEECHCLDWYWNFNIDVSETFSNLAVHLNLNCTWTNLPNVARSWAGNVKCSSMSSERR